MRNLFFALCLLWLAGCATGPYLPPEQPPEISSGVYHRVAKGETLWRISRMYGVELDDLTRVNRLEEGAAIEIGQQLLIPAAQKKEFRPVTALSDDFIWPLKGAVIRRFGESSGGLVNKGLDIRPSSAPDVVACRSGSVAFSADDYMGMGRTLIIDHGDGIFTVYGRNSELYVRAGEQVKQGQLIARAGAAGRDRGVYLHFEVRKLHVPKNPYYYLP